mgnify:FL=1
MGNSEGTINLIKVNGYTREWEDLNDMRIDVVLIKPTKTVYLTALGICSAIKKSAEVFLHISKTSTGKEVFAQKIELNVSAERTSSFYQLETKVKLSGDVSYTFRLEVKGGATYSYEEMTDYVPDRDLIFQISRVLPTACGSPSKLNGTPLASATASTKQQRKKLVSARLASSRDLNDSNKNRAASKRNTRHVTEGDDVSSTCGSDDQSTKPKRKQTNSMNQSRIHMVKLLTGMHYERPCGEFCCSS